MKKIYFALAGVVCVLLAVYLYRICFVGTVFCDNILVSPNDIIVTDTSVKIRGTANMPHYAYRGFEYETDGDDLHIKLRYVVKSPFVKGTDFDVSINGDFSNIENVYLSNNLLDYAIWADNKTVLPDNFPMCITGVNIYDVKYRGNYQSAVENRNSKSEGDDVVWWSKNAVYHAEPYIWKNSKIAVLDTEGGGRIFIRTSTDESVFSVLGQYGYYTY